VNKKSIDSSPISHLEDIFNVKQERSTSNQGEISLLTEIHDQKVIMDFQWIKDLKVLITSFSIDNYEYSFLTHHINRINNNLVIGTLKQNTNTFSDIPIIAVTGASSMITTEQQEHLLGVLEKPFTPDDLIDFIQSKLNWKIV